MSYESAMKELTRPLVFGDENQIHAVRELTKIFTCAESIKSCPKHHAVSYCSYCDGDGEHCCGCGDLHDCCECNGTGYEGFSYTCECVEDFFGSTEGEHVIAESLRLLIRAEEYPYADEWRLVPFSLRPDLVQHTAGTLRSMVR